MSELIPKSSRLLPETGAQDHQRYAVAGNRRHGTLRPHQSYKPPAQICIFLGVIKIPNSKYVDPVAKWSCHRVSGRLSYRGLRTALTSTTQRIHPVCAAVRLPARPVSNSPQDLAHHPRIDPPTVRLVLRLPASVRRSLLIPSSLVANKIRIWKSTDHGRLSYWQCCGSKTK